MKFSESLKKNEDFQKVYRRGKSCANRYLVMYVLPAEYPADCPPEHKKNQIGISVSKKVGNSVVRHRLTRLIRESYRLNEERFKKGYWIVIIVRMTARDKEFSEIEGALLHLAHKQRVLADEEIDDLAH